ncbi:OsmC family protein [Kocuria sp. cx-455]|uniref:OsmC family protein n=1 Tax=unclassified Candidatus Sulfotelmatobacter TaxID=2635724 RepID=UPI0016869CC1|nr:MULTISPECIES: OsmC family protein [unclassified Candidatus Sulfotelmatobacter]MBD2761459.1 OsmC family protein [Kocuria sp. cx-116]MBD2765433.1 OsmC family protein [Kocuria sp. cx-455]
MSEHQNPTHSVELLRTATNRYVARTADGAEVAFGRGEGLLSPVELLLAAIAGCSAIDVDTVTSRSTEPTDFRVEASGDKFTEDSGATRLTDVNLSFRLAFPDDEGGRKAAGLVDRLVALSHDKYCTVSRTVEHATPVAVETEVRVGGDPATTDR